MTRTTRDAVEAVWKQESARLIGGLVRMVRDVDLAQDMAQEALVVALERWPEGGIPDNPGAWLMTTAKHRAVDRARRQQMLARKHTQIEQDAAVLRPAAPDLDVEPDDVGDDLLRLVLIACHPILSPDARVALTLRLLGGLTTAEIARAFLVTEPTVAQRIVRAKRTLAEARVPFEVPRGEALTARVPAVLEVVYLIFNEGYAAARGDAWMREDLCHDALRLGRILVGLLGEHAEVHGLLALMALHASRTPARVTASGEPILLLDQDRTRWDVALIREGLAAQAQAESLARPLGPYALQAAIAACHARARTPAETEWDRIVALYDALVEVTRSPIVALNRAVAVSMAFGPRAALGLVDELVEEPALRRYHLLPTVRGDLLMKLERFEEARQELLRAASLATNARERKLLEDRAAACAVADSSSKA